MRKKIADRAPRATHVPALAALVLVLLAAGDASAHGGLEAGDNPWTAWNVTPEIALGTLVAVGLYGAGLWRRRHKTDRARAWRHVSFFGGVVAIFLALQSPIDVIAEHVFLIHQVQHLLLRMVGPMLVILAAPQGLMVAGLPDAGQRRVLIPILANRAVGAIFRILAHPVVATALFIAALYFWQIPEFHNLALLNDPLHYVMHATMLLAGLVFFWRIFDRRPAPVGTRYGVRLMMLWVMILANIVIGSYLTLKRIPLYSAYDELGRLWGFSALADEELGAATIWIPSSMMGLVAVLIVVHMWGHHETKVASGRPHGLGVPAPGRSRRPTTSHELIPERAPKNRALALGLAIFVTAVFTAAVLVGVASRLIGP